MSTNPKNFRLEETRQSWNAATKNHNSHKLNQAVWLASNSTLFPEEIELIGDLKGRTMLHTLCNSGQDTLSFARMGAIVTGVDVSDVAISFARELSRDSGISARFEHAEVVSYLESTTERFDFVFGSYGCLPWIESLERYFAGVRRVLNPGGIFVVVEFHPLLWSVGEGFALNRDDYFESGVFSEPVSDYVGAADGALSPSGHLALATPDNQISAHAWQHTTAQILTAMCSSGLRIETVREWPHSNGYNAIPGLIREGSTYIFPRGVARIPLMLGIRCVAPEADA